MTVIDHPFAWKDGKSAWWHFHMSPVGSVIMDHETASGAHPGPDCDACRLPSQLNPKGR